MNYHAPDLLHELQAVLAQTATDEQTKLLIEKTVLASLVQKAPPGFTIKTSRSETLKIFPSEFIYAEAQGKCCRIFNFSNNTEEIIPLSISLKKLEALLNPHGMMRIHRSHIVNIDYWKKHHSADRHIGFINNKVISYSKDLIPWILYILHDYR